MKRLLACIPLFAAALQPCLAAHASTEQQPDPYAVFARARGVWAGQRYPHYLSYTIAVNVTERGVQKSRHYHLTYDAQTNDIQVNPVSDEERAAPPVPSGFLWHLQPRRQHQVLFDRKVGNPGEAVDYLGVPKLAPTYSFGMNTQVESQGPADDGTLVAQIRAQFNDPMPEAKDRELAAQGDLKSIASVTSRARNYTIRFAGTDVLDGESCYHLSLSPNGDPNLLRLRDVWIDEQTYETRQLVTAGNFTASQVPWLVRFTDIGGAQYIASETAQAPVGVGPHRYESASIAFQAIAESTAPAGPANTFITKDALMTEPGAGAHQ